MEIEIFEEVLTNLSKIQGFSPKLKSKISGPLKVAKERILAAGKGTEGAEMCVVKTINKAWKPVDLFLSFPHSKEKCTQFGLSIYYYKIGALFDLPQCTPPRPLALGG